MPTTCPYGPIATESGTITVLLNKGFAQVTAVPLNHGAGVGMEVPCIFRL